MRLLLTTAIVVSLAVPSLGFAQEDDLLAPLTPGENSAPKPKKNKKKNPNQGPRGGGSSSSSSSSSSDDDLISTLKPPTELLVTLQDQIVGAKLFIDGQEMGPLNGQPVEVAPGEHRVLVKRPGFDDFLASAKVADGEREKIPVFLIPSAGVLNIQPNVPAADVYLDGKLIGKGAIKDLVVKPGSYEIRVAKAGYAPEVSRLSMRAGKDYTLTPMLMPELAQGDRPERNKLEPRGTGTTTTDPMGHRPDTTLAAAEPPWFGRWYVWAGVAVVAAAAAGGTYAVVNQPTTTPVGTLCPAGGCDTVFNPPTGARQRGAVMLVPMAPVASF